MAMRCPKCDADISDTYEGDDYSCGIVAGWSCDTCGLGFAEHEYPREPMDDDVGIPPAPPRADGKIGTPLSKLSSQPGPKDDPGHPDHARYAEFCRIASSWGYE